MPANLRNIAVIGIVFGVVWVSAVLASPPSKANGQLRTILPGRDLVVAPGWAGTWRITTTYRDDPLGGAAIDDVTNVIRAGELLGVAAVTRAGLASCRGAMDKNRLVVECSTRLRDSGCTLAGHFSLNVKRTGDTISGVGSGTGGIKGVCAFFASPVRSSLELHGSRLSTGQEGAPDPGRLITRFVASSPLFSLAVNLPQTTPAVANDCVDGNWATFTKPAFSSQASCLKFLRRAALRKNGHKTS